MKGAPLKMPELTEEQLRAADYNFIKGYETRIEWVDKPPKQGIDCFGVVWKIKMPEIKSITCPFCGKAEVLFNYRICSSCKKEISAVKFMSDWNEANPVAVVVLEIGEREEDLTDEELKKITHIYDTPEPVVKKVGLVKPVEVINPVVIEVVKEFLSDPEAVKIVEEIEVELETIIIPAEEITNVQDLVEGERADEIFVDEVDETVGAHCDGVCDGCVVEEVEVKEYKVGEVMDRGEHIGVYDLTKEEGD